MPHYDFIEELVIVFLVVRAETASHSIKTLCGRVFFTVLPGSARIWFNMTSDIRKKSKRHFEKEDWEEKEKNSQENRTVEKKVLEEWEPVIF